MAGPRPTQSSTLTSTYVQQQQEENMFKQQDRSPAGETAETVVSPKKVASSVTDSFDQPAVAKPYPIGGKILGRVANRTVASESSTSRTSSATSALASLTRNNDDLDFSNSTSLNLPSIGNSERPRLAPSTGNTMTSSNIVTSQATATSSNSYPARVSSGRTSPRNDIAKKRHPRGLVGLQNLGNTCFMNSCLQCVSNLPAIVKYFHPGLYTREVNDTSPTKGALANAFGDLIKALCVAFTGYDQQDAQEFLRFLLDGLHEDLNRVKKKPAYYEIKDRPEAKDRDVSDEYWKFYLERNTSALSELFCGQLRSEIRCETCNHRSLCFDVFWDLSLPVPKKSGKNSAMRISSGFFSGGRTASATSDTAANSTSGGMSIHDCLKAYTEQELLSDDAAYYAPSKISVYRLPNVLVLHLKRFSYSTFSRDKVSTSISFPAQSLNIAEYCASDAVVDGSTLYDLTGIVHHMGSLNGGHYTAECLNADTQEWFDFNDGSVTAIRKPELCSSSAYMLFYQRREEKSLTI
ncbi:Ubiquitin specific protease domain [Phytophthora cactorum]|nr:Ubiquitin specific protease domain [Phytophthora cactorum]